MDFTRKRALLGDWIESTGVQRIIIALIVVNAAILGMETSPALMAGYGEYLIAADQLILSVFVAEILIKLIATGRRFFSAPWNIFDFVVVGIALVPASGPLAVLRALRVLRVLRLISVVPRLRFVVEALLRAIPGILSIGVLLIILFYVFAVMATSLYGSVFSEWFGSIGKSMYSLFQIMTLESWSMGIVRPVMTEFPYAWMFFVPFILVATFTILNLFIGIVVDTMQSMHQNEHAQDRDHIEAAAHQDATLLLEEMRELKREIQDIRGMMERGQSDAHQGP